MVGRNLLEHPAARDHQIDAPSRAELDLRDAGAVSRRLADFSPELVIHAAGKVGGIQANMREPVSFLLDNLDMGRNVVWGARRQGVHRLVNLGSSCMYPRDAQNPLREEMVLKGELEPTNEGYAIAKVTVAKLCEYITREDPAFQYKTLIPCNLYGRWDKFDPRHSHMVPAIIHKLHLARTGAGAEVDIWGTGDARREFMYAGDLADCIWRSVARFDTLPQCMNVGLGHDLSVNEYYQTAARVIGFNGKFVHDLSRPVGMQQKLVSVDLARAWGWTAATSLEQGLARTYEHYLKEFAK
jgi:GDP-L-fucose synthase